MAPFFQKTKTTGGTKAGYFAARLVSDLGNPLFIPPFVLAVVAQARLVAADEFGWLLGLALLFYTLIPLLIIFYMLRAGEIQSLDLPRQRERKPLFLYYLASSAMGSALLGSYFYLHHSSLTVISVIFALNPLAGFLLNKRWKISIHAAAVASAGAIFLALPYLDSEIAATETGIFSLFILLILLPLMIWARYYLEVHSPGEIVAGAASGLLLTLTELKLMIQFG